MSLEDKSQALEGFSASEEERYELQDGVLVPVEDVSVAHSMIQVNLVKMIATFLEGKTCKVLLGPVPVYLFDGREDVPEEYQRPVCPDIMVVCDPEKLDAKSCKGAPDFVIEILSPSNRGNDEVRKFDLYGMAGVREYWMVYPEAKRVHVCVRDGNRFKVIRVYWEEEQVPVSVLPGCVINLEQVFGDL